MAPLLELDGVVAGYGGGDILRGLDLVVDEGSITCLVGPNGAGKSTVLKLVSGLLSPRRGAVRFKGESIGGLSPRAILKLGLVQVPQDRSLFPSMSVRENVRLGGFSLRDRGLTERRLAEVTDTFSIVAERGEELAASLSGGQQKLVEFARAMMLDPAVLLLDEPSMGLEPKIRTMVFDMVRQLNASGRTILLVEQNARSGLELADHGVVLETGQVRLEGTGAEILSHPHLGELYLGKRTPEVARAES
ncbi:MAG TPA: ABC transporter ATP-binding protein [Solirubrobacteraceae bacterium]|jgi:branched-chain amino acid transport system ATP-binding protein|nr:ABC transporter ATP-binding protein [Solirubrobacteraceae bacterium]